MKAKFYAFDAAGKRVNASATEFSVTEDGLPRKVLSASCPTFTTKQISSVLVVDVSGSMNGSNIDLAKAAAAEWIDRMDPGNSECALSSFDDANYLNQDFTSNRAKLHAAVDNLSASGGTDYDKGLLLPYAGALEITKKAKYEPVIVFLTDGICSSAQVQKIITEANRQQCRVFVVTVGLQCPMLLKDIASGTGGAWFEYISDRERIVDVYRAIHSLALGIEPCELRWQSEVSCTRDLRKLDVAWNNLHRAVWYNCPQKGIAKLTVSPSAMYIGPKPIGEQFDTTITVTAVNADFTITNVISSDVRYEILPKSFSLASGQSRQLTIRYTPRDSTLSWSTFTFEGIPCTEQYLVSSYVTDMASASRLELVHPNGGEVFLAGSDTIITWKGVSETEAVRLEYSLDGGATWGLITSNATGLEYSWHVPSTVSSTCLVRVTQQDLSLSNSDTGWVRHIIRTEGNAETKGYGIASNAQGVYVVGTTEESFGAKGFFLRHYLHDGTLQWEKRNYRAGAWLGSVSPYDVSVDAQGNIYAVGDYNGLVMLNGFEFGRGSEKGIFIIKYDATGKMLWGRNATSRQAASALACAATPAGDLYVGGYFFDSLQFGSTVLLPVNGDKELFLAKYAADGTLTWAKSDGSRVDDYITRIEVDKNGCALVTGLYSKTSFPPDMQSFVAKFLPDGTRDWLEGPVGAGSSLGEGIAYDKGSSMYMLGHLFGEVIFDPQTIITSGSMASQDIFIARYLSDGTFNWVRQIGSDRDDKPGSISHDLRGGAYIACELPKGRSVNFMDTTISNALPCLGVAQLDFTGQRISYQQVLAAMIESSDMAVDSTGVYIVGTFTGPAYFPSDTLTYATYTTSYLWKIPFSTNVRPDISDAVFSIVKPQPLALGVDMGDVVVGKMKDSVVQAYIQNPGTYPFHVDSIDISGADAPQFTVVSGLPPFTVAAGATQEVEFRFAPASPGPKAAQLTIRTQADTLVQVIRGNGLQATITALGTIIDFGTLEMMTSKDTTLAVAITNVGSVPIDFTGDTQLGPDQAQFSLLSGGGVFTLAPNESREVSIRFAPRFIGRTSGRIGFHYNGSGSPAILQLFGQGLGGSVRIEDDSAYPGDKPDISLTLGNAPSSNLQSLAAGFRVRVAYNSTVLAPFMGTIARGSGIDTVTLEGALIGNNTLTSIPFLTALGNAETSSMELLGFDWLDAQGQPVNYDVETQSGTFKLLGLCEEGGKRLFNPNGQVAISRISPNPASERMVVDIETIERGRTQVVMVDVLGRIVAKLFDGEIAGGSHQLELRTSNIAPGSYYLSLVTPTVKKFMRVDIFR